MNNEQPEAKAKTFTFINDERLAEIINSARSRVIYAAPSVSTSVAESLCAFADNHENGALRVILDGDPEVLRLGFGEVDGIKRLSDRRIDLRLAPGLRIGVLLSDEKAWVYSPTPEIILEQPMTGINNGLEVHLEFAKQILFSIAPDIKVMPDDDVLDQQIIQDELILDPAFPEQPSKDILDESFLTDDPTPEIGIHPFGKAALTRIETALEQSPPQKFDATRKIRVYQGHFQFVELSFSGCRLNSKTISLPQYLFNIKDEDLQNRVKATCRVLGEKGRFSLRVKIFEERIRDLRKKFVYPLGGRFGAVILRNKSVEFNKEVKEITVALKDLQQSITDDLSAELLSNTKDLKKMLLPGLMENPPTYLINNGRTLDENLAQEIIDFELKKLMPNPEDLISKMELHCDYKDVTYDMLNNDDFKKAIKKYYPEFEKLYSETDTIAQRMPPGKTSDS